MKKIYRFYKRYAIAILLLGLIAPRSVCGDAPPHANDTTNVEASALKVSGSHLVRLKSDAHPKRKPFYVMVRLINPTSSDITVTVENPDKHLKFAKSKMPDYSDLTDTIDLTIPKPTGTNTYGDPVSFAVTGDKGSANLGDAKIKVVRADDLTKEVGKWDMTVFWFKNPIGKKNDEVGGHMLLTANSPYQVSVNQNNNLIILGPNGNFGSIHSSMKFESSVQLMPTDLVPNSIPSSTDQSITDLRIGLEQTATSRTVQVTYGKPTIEWANFVPPGILTPPVKSGGSINSDVVGKFCDAGEAADIPFYHRPSITAIKDKSSTVDGPFVKSFYKFTESLKDAQGNIYAKVIYSITSISMDVTFNSFCTIGDTEKAVKGETQWLSESKWSVHVNLAVPSVATGTATVGAPDIIPPSDDSVEDPPLANDKIPKLPTGKHENDDTVTFTCPNVNPNP